MDTEDLGYELIKLDFQKGDVLAFKVKGKLSMEELDRITSYLRVNLPYGIKFIIINSNQVELSIIRQGTNANHD